MKEILKNCFGFFNSNTTGQHLEKNFRDYEGLSWIISVGIMAAVCDKIIVSMRYLNGEIKALKKALHLVGKMMEENRQCIFLYQLF